jgi:3-oxo-5-alpha-steroid 4-dehydrogenase 1
MTERTLFDLLLLAWFALSAITFVVTLYVSAPYGRHVERSWGPMIGNRLGWIVMEAPAPLVFAACFVLGLYWNTAAAIAFLVLWEAHYAHRAFIFPFGLRGRGKLMPVAVAGSGFLFNVVNGYLNGRYLFTLSGGYPARWLWSWQFIIGLVVFIAGFIINRQSDRTLRNLRKPGESGYKIPRGGLFRWVSCPNYLGEIIQWGGWAIAAWALPGLAFAVWTAANLIPRALAHHRWYRAHFNDYPPGRKAVLPGLL